ncbi:hypothetical protein EDD18DRAFT_1113972 [Armillaria luteobubalina]|uniref:Uncharacterized protein n=1 Tax=Armillaria luteobubalina TaxID=153913 RepID=A0AA39P866_9AGAR|nr:hypothetical protein EDD18DRAFT_1113972 [Armillaria luteobubalina]
MSGGIYSWRIRQRLRRTPYLLQTVALNFEGASDSRRRRDLTLSLRCGRDANTFSTTCEAGDNTEKSTSRTLVENKNRLWTIISEIDANFHGALTVSRHGARLYGPPKRSAAQKQVYGKASVGTFNLLDAVADVPGDGKYI